MPKPVWTLCPFYFRFHTGYLYLDLSYGCLHDGHEYFAPLLNIFSSLTFQVWLFFRKSHAKLRITPFRRFTCSRSSLALKSALLTLTSDVKLCLVGEFLAVTFSLRSLAPYCHRDHLDFLTCQITGWAKLATVLLWSCTLIVIIITCALVSAFTLFRTVVKAIQLSIEHDAERFSHACWTTYPHITTSTEVESLPMGVSGLFRTSCDNV